MNWTESEMFNKIIIEWAADSQEVCCTLAGIRIPLLSWKITITTITHAFVVPESIQYLDKSELEELAVVGANSGEWTGFEGMFKWP